MKENKTDDYKILSNLVYKLLLVYTLLYRVAITGWVEDSGFITAYI